MALAWAVAFGGAADAAQVHRDTSEHKMKVPAHRVPGTLGLRRDRLPPARVTLRNKAPQPPVVKADSPAHVVSALDAAAQSSGLEPALLHAMAWSESRLNPTARNRRSTARGLMQFTEASWLAAVRDFGPRHGLARAAGLLSTNSKDGSITTRRWRDRRAILALRDNPRLSALMAAQRVAAQRAQLSQVLGRDAQPADLFFVHLLGPTGGRLFAAATREAPGQAAVEAIGHDSARLNRELFVEPDGGRALSVAEVHQQVERWINAQQSANGTAVAAVRGAIGAI